MAGIHKLSARQIETLPSGKHGDGGGLWLNVRDGGASRQWFLRVTVHRRRREMGLGGYPALSLKNARDAAAQWRNVAKAGNDPVKVREKQRRDALRNLHQFGDVARNAFEARKSELKDEGNAGRWISPLERHVIPKLDGPSVCSDDSQIGYRMTHQNAPLACIWPIW